jgi:hypothetical protein
LDPRAGVPCDGRSGGSSLAAQLIHTCTSCFSLHGPPRLNPNTHPLPRPHGRVRSPLLTRGASGAESIVSALKGLYAAAVSVRFLIQHLEHCSGVYYSRYKTSSRNFLPTLFPRLHSMAAGNGSPNVTQK